LRSSESSLTAALGGAFEASGAGIFSVADRSFSPVEQRNFSPVEPAEERSKFSGSPRDLFSFSPVEGLVSLEREEALMVETEDTGRASIFFSMVSAN